MTKPRMLGYLEIANTCEAELNVPLAEWDFPCGLKITDELTKDIKPIAALALRKAHREHHAHHSGQIYTMLCTYDKSADGEKYSVECEHEKVPACSNTYS